MHYSALHAGTCFDQVVHYLEEVEIGGMLWPARSPDLNAVENSLVEDSKSSVIN